MSEGRVRSSAPIGLQWRSSTAFILMTVGLGMFTDIFLYGLVTPVMPFMLEEHIGVPHDQIQTTVSNLLAIYAASTFMFSPIAGFIADRSPNRKIPFLAGLASLLVGTLLLALGKTVPQLAFARVFQGFSAAVVWTVALAVSMETVGRDNLGTTIGTVSDFS